MNLKGINVEGLGIDICTEDGEERWDLLQTVSEFIVDDVRKFLESGSSYEGDDKRNPDFLYAILSLLDRIEDSTLLNFLPRDNGIYIPTSCGEFRLESYQNDRV